MWHYQDKNGQWQGSINGVQLKILVNNGTITRKTPMRDTNGNVVPAERIYKFPPEKEWYYRDKKEQWQGPFDKTEVQPFADKRIIHPDTVMLRKQDGQQGRQQGLARQLTWIKFPEQKISWVPYVVFGSVFGFLAFLIAMSIFEYGKLTKQQEGLTLLWQCETVVRFGLIAFGLSIAESIMKNNFSRAALRGVVGGVIGMAAGLLLAIRAWHGFVQILVLHALIGCFIAIAPGIIPLNIKKIVIGALGGAISMVLILLLQFAPIYIVNNGYSSFATYDYICLFMWRVGVGSLIGFVIGTSETTTGSLSKLSAWLAPIVRKIRTAACFRVAIALIGVCIGLYFLCNIPLFIALFILVIVGGSTAAFTIWKKSNK